MSSKVEICNLALSHLGIAKEVQNLENDAGQEAQACRRFYDNARDETLRDFPWSFATKFATLAVVEDAVTTDEWTYAYRYPTDALKIRRILSGSRNDSRQSRVPYKIVQDTAGLLLYTDMEDAVMEYTVKTTETTKFPVDFVMALSYRIAYYIAPRLTGGDPFKLGPQAMQNYARSLSKAAATNLNEEQVEEDVQAESIRARDS